MSRPVVPRGSWVGKVKDTVLFVGGLAGMVWEFSLPEPRPILVGACLLALGFGSDGVVVRLLGRFAAPPPAADPAPQQESQP